jgi:hypothetical protein
MKIQGAVKGTRQKVDISKFSAGRPTAAKYFDSTVLIYQQITCLIGRPELELFQLTQFISSLFVPLLGFISAGRVKI